MDLHGHIISEVRVFDKLARIIRVGENELYCILGFRILFAILLKNICSTTKLIAVDDNIICGSIHNIRGSIPSNGRDAQKY